MFKENADFLINYQERLEAERQTWNSAYQEIIDYTRPQKEPIHSDGIKGSQRGRELIFDSTAHKSMQRLSSSLGSLLTNPDSIWFNLETNIKKINKQHESQVWFDETTRVLMRVFENSNFYNEAYKFYMDLVSFGTAILLAEKSKKRNTELVFATRDVKEMYISENSEGAVDVAFRDCKMTARQVWDQFGEENLSDKAKKMYEKEPEQYIQVLHSVFPREGGMVNAEPENKPFASIWIEKDTKQILKKSGEDTFPYIVARWSKETNERYGRSPTMDAMADIRTLNKMVYVFLLASEYAANPMLAIPHEGWSNFKNKGPGSFVYYDAELPGDVKTITSKGDVLVNAESIKMYQDGVMDVYFVNQLQLIDKREMTAQEVRARQAENARILAPIFGTLNYEFLARLIDRSMSILDGEIDIVTNTTLLPKAPPSIRRQDLKLKFVSPLAKAQRQHEGQSIAITLNAAMQWAQAKPEVLDNINWDTSIRLMSDIDGSPAAILNDEKVVQNIRDQRAAAIQRQQEVQMAMSEAKALKDGAKGMKDIKTIGE